MTVYIVKDEYRIIRGVFTSYEKAFQKILTAYNQELCSLYKINKGDYNNFEEFVNDIIKSGDYVEIDRWEVK